MTLPAAKCECGPSYFSRVRLYISPAHPVFLLNPLGISSGLVFFSPLTFTPLPPPSPPSFLQQVHGQLQPVPHRPAPALSHVFSSGIPKPFYYYPRL